MIPLTRRERRLGIGVAAALAAWGIYALAIQPMRDRIQQLRRLIPEKQNELREVQAKSAEYLAFEREFEQVQERMAQQDPDFQLLPFLESLTEQHGLKAYLVRMQQQDAPSAKPGYAETIVEIALEGVPLRHLVDFLRAIDESAVAAQVWSLHLHKQTQGQARLDATIQICSPSTIPPTVAADWTVR
ncbi:MAG TPA: type II secretion system protein GspM [Sedimentisphaerales bacterium]|mgnify:CR=1 FL=1|nr:type II secretion system protein GspM [Sedimentisphaerales bacterium]HRS10149.1 type II secretion system protein GspM [Sedimentisphaerales bacterium]HRV46855.1 type II secretion system protein GspM [Sedimentisphaerales bacterium]